MNGVSFRAAMDSAKDLLNAPQTFSRPQAAAQPANLDAPVKKSSAKKTIFKTLVTAAVVAGALAAGKHYKVFDKLVEWGAKGNSEKFVGKMQNYAGKAGEYLNKGGEWLMTKGSAVVNWCKDKWPFGKK